MNSLRHFVVPPQSGRGFRVRQGQHVRVIDPEGQQVADMWAFTTSGGLDWLSTSQTRDITERLFPIAGECFYSERAERLLTLVENNSPSLHDTLFPACNPGLYERAGLSGHPNCRDNLLAAVHEAGIEPAIVPDPVNFFQNSSPQPNGRLEVLASNNPPGGNVVLRAETDLLLVITACSVDFHPTNGGICTAIAVEIE
ncbi:hypothetical protein BJ122_101163 [Rhodopseudomonas faecalis]|uniref:DUF1989 domain-containing protein n=1 Tax=Rhodopseudomonas faecalis TaxID=99655 RepID=A0A318TLS0_9BRAD|nr:urea carboxylase-associated family protein [Rhodopseudomonas faecalis]PYF05423.1 hypothetical protein BJ122_101163 [Rhodopseudomonas faecalis]